jgi:membrane protein DedA with SNARE-associated domain
MDGGIVSVIEEYLRGGESLTGLLVIFAASMGEYVFPPLPGDTVVLFGAFLAAWASWSTWKVFVATVAGALAGAWIDTVAGRAIRDVVTGKTVLPPRGIARLLGFTRRPSFQDGVRKVIEKFEKHGVGIILVNRFFPGIRAFFFVGAGVAALPMWKVLLLGGISAAAWNTVIFYAGHALGNNWDALLAFSRTYAMAVNVALALAAALAVAYFLVRRARRRRSTKGSRKNKFSERGDFLP